MRTVEEIRAEVAARARPDLSPPSSAEILTWADEAEAAAVTDADRQFVRNLRETALMTQTRFGR